MKLAKSLTCELLGTAFLLATVVGSGILAHRLDNGIVAITIISVALATGCVLFALIATFGSISCHVNPAVTLVSAIRKEMPWRNVLPYFAAQILGAIAGVIAANLMFDLPAVTWSTSARTGLGQWIGEFIATFGLLGIILGSGKYNPQSSPQAISAYVAGAIWFTSSTCFANPAVTVGRIFTDTITGIRLADVPAFIVVQIVAAVIACVLFSWLFSEPKADEPSEMEPNTTPEVEESLPERELVSSSH